MNKRLLDWLQVLGNLGLLIGIVLVAVQLQQNAQLMKAQLAHDSWLHASDQFMTHLGEEPAKVLAKLADGDLDLSNEELIAANSLYTTMLIAIARVEYTNNAGLDLYEPEMTARLYAPNFVEGFGLIMIQFPPDPAKSLNEVWRI